MLAAAIRPRSSTRTASVAIDIEVRMRILSSSDYLRRIQTK